MSEDLRCPDCGRVNEPGAVECVQCGFPLSGAPGVPATPPSSATETPVVVPRPRPRRPRPQRADNTVLSLWLVFGTIAALVVVWVAVNSNVNRTRPPVEGASPAQQANADSLLAIVQRDTTNVDARNQLADVLYDTGNWSDAIVQYRATVRMDSTRVAAIVDMGVCYFNLSDGAEAERLFKLAIGRDPHQVVALFNLGILYESRKQWKESLQYFHEAMQSNPPPAMEQPLQDHMLQVMKQVGGNAPPLPSAK
jgi:cytochrome c-type biogenesis protein CcmH/NrfG